MIRRIDFILRLTIEDHKRLIALKPWNNKWNDDSINDIKNKIRIQLKNNQNCCAYCGLPFKGEKDQQIEHIAPKAGYRQPQFTFTLYNLVLSCGYCNNLIVKGTKETLQLPAHRLYKKCNFLIVHPYFDDPDNYYDWIDTNDRILIQIKNNEDKARYTIRMFGLNSEEMNTHRAAFSLLEKQKRLNPISEANEILLQNTLNYKA